MIVHKCMLMEKIRGVPLVDYRISEGKHTIIVAQNLTERQRLEVTIEKAILISMCGHFSTIDGQERKRTSSRSRKFINAVRFV